MFAEVRIRLLGRVRRYSKPFADFLIIFEIGKETSFNARQCCMTYSYFLRDCSNSAFTAFF